MKNLTKEQLMEINSALVKCHGAVLITFEELSSDKYISKNIFNYSTI